ncbi:hypothetical protein [Planomonospora venezuelensis]|uniref:hypothetical protein n=1 Tax=Planomonospora venezuelensis TaxID=1999 RepID=UPI00366B5A3E
MSSPNDELVAEAIPAEKVPRSRLRPWMAAAVLLIAGGAAAAWFFGARAEGVLPPPDGPWPEQRGFMVLRCSQEGLTPETQPVVEKFLRTVPEIESLTAYSKAQMEGEPLATRNVCGVQAHFVGTARDAGDVPEIAQEIAKSPVPVALVRLPSDFWAGKADVRIELTRPGSPLLQLGAEGARVATGKDREAIVEKVRQTVDVEAVYFEDGAFATKVNASYCPDRLCVFEPGPVDRETLYVKTGTPGAAETLRSALEDMPGVELVFPIRTEVF